MDLIRAVFKLASPQQERCLNSNQGSLMQGMMMQKIRPAYAELLHRSELKPYSQYLRNGTNGNVWILQTLTPDAAEEIWNKAELRTLSQFCLEHRDVNVQVTERKFEHLSEEELLEQTFFHTCPRKAVIHFVTPAAFKSNGSYLNYPTIRRIFQSLLNKFNAVSSSSSLDMDLVLDDIEKNVIATGYRLKSTYFNLEGIKVPSFLGSLALFTKGPQQMVNLIYMLLQFGTYSGVGIKTAMGMGGICVEGKDMEKWKM